MISQFAREKARIRLSKTDTTHPNFPGRQATINPRRATLNNLVTQVREWSAFNTQENRSGSNPSSRRHDDTWVPLHIFVDL